MVRAALEHFGVFEAIVVIGVPVGFWCVLACVVWAIKPPGNGDQKARDDVKK